jgi:Family of unknown function (DUF6113)
MAGKPISSRALASLQSVHNATPGQRGGAFVVISAYALLFVLGVLEGVVGCFHYSGTVSSFPAAALAFAAVTFLTCVLAAWGMRTPTAGLMPAVGWFAASFVLAMATPGGSVVITNTTAGKWFLYGGSACAVAGVVAAYAGKPRSRSSRAGR